MDFNSEGSLLYHGFQHDIRAIAPTLKPSWPLHWVLLKSNFCLFLILLSLSHVFSFFKYYSHKFSILTHSETRSKNNHASLTLHCPLPSSFTSVSMSWKSWRRRPPTLWPQPGVVLPLSSQLNVSAKWHRKEALPHLLSIVLYRRGLCHCRRHLIFKRGWSNVRFFLATSALTFPPQCLEVPEH